MSVGYIFGRHTKAQLTTVVGGDGGWLKSYDKSCPKMTS